MNLSQAVDFLIKNYSEQHAFTQANQIRNKSTSEYESIQTVKETNPKLNQKKKKREQSKMNFLESMKTRKTQTETNPNSNLSKEEGEGVEEVLGDQITEEEEVNSRIKEMGDSSQTIGTITETKIQIGMVIPIPQRQFQGSL